MYGKRSIRTKLVGHNMVYKGLIEVGDPLRELDAILGQDVRDHPEWVLPEDNRVTYINWERQDEFLVYNGDEKSYGGADQLRIILLNTIGVELHGVITYRSDYGDVGVIECLGRELEEKESRK